MGSRKKGVHKYSKITTLLEYNICRARNNGSKDRQYTTIPSGNWEIRIREYIHTK